jgi:hypothetical protein
MDRFQDSAGVPWQGREFSDNAFANDDGSTPPALARVFESTVFDKSNLFSALETSRVLIPLIAQLGESKIGSHGHTVDKSAELSIVAVSTPDNQTALPVFSSVVQMQLWNNAARPVPVDMRRVSLAAISEGHTRVVLDAGSRAIVLRRPMLSALAQSMPWAPPHTSPDLGQMVEEAKAGSSAIADFELIDGDDQCNLGGPELIIQLSVNPGLSKEELDAELAGFTASLQKTKFLELVDSVSFKILSA